MSESILQKNLVATFRMLYPKYYTCFFAIENKRKTKNIWGLKLHGITPGVADLCLALPTFNSGALYIELKYGKNKQTKKQKDWQRDIILHGNSYIVCYSVDEALKRIIPYIKEHQIWKQRNK